MCFALQHKSVAERVCTFERYDTADFDGINFGSDDGEECR